MRLISIFTVLLLGGCQITVDKRVHVTNHIVTFGPVSIPTEVRNTSETKTDAEQAFDGQLSLPLIP